MERPDSHIFHTSRFRPTDNNTIPFNIYDKELVTLDSSRIIIYYPLEFSLSWYVRILIYFIHPGSAQQRRRQVGRWVMSVAFRWYPSRRVVFVA